MEGSRSLFRQCVALFAALALVLGQATMITPAFAADADPTTKIRHRAPGYFVPDHRIKLEADVRDKQGLKLVRCYFRAAGEENFVFVAMEQAWGNKFQAVLPAPSAATQELEYLFLAVNDQNQVVKSQTFTIGKDEMKKVPSWQDVPGDGTIQVATELETAPEMVVGFQDNITVDVVESSLRFGVVAGGLYAANAAVGGTTGAAATASSAGAVTAGAGISTTAAVVGGAVALGAVAGGAAAAGGGGGGGTSGGSSGGGGGGTDPSPPPPPGAHPPRLSDLKCPSRVKVESRNCIELNYYDAGGDITKLCGQNVTPYRTTSRCFNAAEQNITGNSGRIRDCTVVFGSRPGTSKFSLWAIDSQNSQSNTVSCTVEVY